MTQRVQVTGFSSWREHARALLAADVPPNDVEWHHVDEQGELFAASSEPVAVAHPQVFEVPRAFVSSMRWVAQHHAPERWSLGYRVLWRITHGEHGLLDDGSDADVAALRLLKQAVHRDAERMRAFVRFRRVDDELGPHYIAWHRPDHDVLPLVAPFFADRFASQRWTVLGPTRSVHWDGERLEYGPGVPRSSAPEDDALEQLWRTYYAAVFNRPRVNMAAMQRHLPRKHWGGLPELTQLDALRADASTFVDARAQGVEAPLVLPDARDIASLRAAASSCTACPLYLRATQTVFGEGRAPCALVLVGEQPGDQEDVAGHPFVGPAGRVLDRVLHDAGIERDDVYLTNAVKHFKWRPTGSKKRLHQHPSGGEIERCKPWLIAELDALQPRVVVALGAIAGQSLLGRRPAVGRERARLQPGPHALPVMVTYHPSAVLRADERQHADDIFAAMVSDLRDAMAATKS